MSRHLTKHWRTPGAVESKALMAICKGMVPKKLPLLLGKRLSMIMAIGRGVVSADCHQEMDMQASQ